MGKHLAKSSSLIEIVKVENKKNSKERSYTNMDKGKEGNQADLLSKEKPRNHHDIPRKMGGNEKALVTKEMALSNLGENIFIGDSDVTSHMTSKKLRIYNLVPINRYSKDASYMKYMRTFGEMAVVAIHQGKKMRSKLDNRGKQCMFVGYAEDHAGDVYRFLNIHTKRIIMSRDVRWLNIIWKHCRMKSMYARKQVELILDEEERSIEDKNHMRKILW